MRKRLMLFSCLLASAGMALAQSQVKGTVISSEDGLPVTGATVRVEGSSTGTVTDANGHFTLSAPEGAKIQISYLGMTPQTVRAGSNMRVSLAPDERILDDLIVVAYGTAKKKAYTGAASEIKAAKIENRQFTNISSALVGSMAGVQTLQTNGQPGENVTIRVRGISSINGDNNPLYVVDGVPFDGELSSINPQDIASMTVLKDAVSTSLYGARGSNGVVMITTKRGQKGKTKITVDAKWGAVSRELSNYDVMTSPAQYLETLYQGYYNQYYYNKGNSAYTAHVNANADVLSKPGYRIYTVPEGQSLIGTNGKLNPNATLGYNDGTYYYTPDDWSDETFSTTLRQEYNVGISGASDLFNYYASFGYLSDDGVIKNSGFDRMSGRLNVEYKAKKWLTIGANMGYTHSVSLKPHNQDSDNASSSGNAFYIANNIAPIYPMYVRGADGQIKYDEALGEKVYDYGDGSSTNSTRNWMNIANPIGDLVYNKREYNSDIFKGNWFAKADLTHGFTATARIALDKDNTMYSFYTNPRYGQSASSGGQNSEQQIRQTAFTHQYLLGYTQTFGHHNVSATAGFEGYRLKYQYFYGTGSQLYKMGDATLSNTTDKPTVGGADHEYHTAGFFFKGDYNYNERFFVNVGYRRDGTSAFAPENRWGDFFNFGLGWDMKKEAWLADFQPLDQLKLRASFGQTGNDNHNYDANLYGWYAYQDIYKVTGSGGSFADGTLLYKGNPNLKWEKNNSFDFGVDFSFWRGRLHGAADFFFRATSNLLDFKNVAYSNGYSKYPVNMGTVQNYGFEFEVAYDIFRTKDFTWNVALNATAATNRIHKLSSDYTDGKYINGNRIYREGESIYNLYLVEYAGVDPATGEALYWSVKTEKDASGNTVAVKDDNGNNIEEKNSDYQSAYTYNRKESGSLLPDFYGGFSTSLEWKGFDFSLQTSFQLGGQVFDSGYQYLMATGGSSMSAGRNYHKDVLKAWTETNTDTDVPRNDAADLYAAATSTRFLVSSDYFSIDNITLGYTLPKSLLSHVGIEGVRVYCSAENVALFSERQGLDPRLSQVAVSNSWYTARRTVSAGVKVTF